MPGIAPWPPVNPGKLSNLQRDYIIAASHFHNGEPIPFAGMHVPYQGRHAFNGLVTRGFLKEHGHEFFYLTEKGWKVAWAINGLNGNHYNQREIEKYLKIKD